MTQNLEFLLIFVALDFGLTWASTKRLAAVASSASQRALTPPPPGERGRHRGAVVPATFFGSGEAS